MYRISREIPRLYNYMDALAHEAEIKPIRGRSPECKPIGPRRATHMQIRKDPDESIVCRLYNTDVVTYHKNGVITLYLEGFLSPTTMDFITYITGETVGLRYGRAWVHATQKGMSEAGWYALHERDTNVFVRNGNGLLEMQNPTPVFVHRVERARANNVRKQYKHFKEYVKRMLKVRDDGFSHQEFGDVFGWVHRDLPNYPTQLVVRTNWKPSPSEVARFLELARSTDTVDQYKAMLWLVRSSTYMRNGYWGTNEKSLIKDFDDLMMYGHRDEVFVAYEREPGDFTNDPYKKFFE
jgi:hypothetical protein